MTTWLPRGVLLAIGMVLLRLVQGALINASPTNAGAISFGLCALFGLAALIWGLFDGMADARANPDPDRRRDLAMRWLLAGLVAGVLSGLVTWLISLFYSAVYVDGLGPELIVFPAFTTLLIFLPAMFAVAAGRWLVDRRRPPFHRQRGGAPAGDVFDAVSEDDPNEKYAVSRNELDWRQEAREAVRLEHEEADLRLHDRE
ncbi:MAG: B-4DMT family transporter [Mycobacteriaceae bacterium]